MKAAVNLPERPAKSKRILPVEIACPAGAGCATLGPVNASPSPPARRSRSGQTMVEYVLAFVVLLGLAFALAALGGALRENGDRSVSLASSEYP